MMNGGISMRRVIAMMVAAFMLLSGACAAAQGFDLSGMTEAELIALIDAARLELARYIPDIAEGDVLYEDEHLSITYTGELEVDQYGSLVVHIIAENRTGMDLMITTSDVSVNGWAVMDAAAEVPAMKMARIGFDFMDAVRAASIETPDEVKDITGELHYFDTDTWEFTSVNHPFRWTFGN
jgi:hypothetical protein